MIFKYITIDLEFGYNDLPKEVTYSFFLKSRPLCSFLERYIKPLKWQTMGFNQFSVSVIKAPLEVTHYINSCNVAVVYLVFDDLDDYYQIAIGNTEKLNEYYIAMLLSALEKVKTNYNLPYDDIKKGIKAFRENNYVDQWVFKRKSIAGKKAYCSIVCKMTTEHFYMDVVVDRGEHEIFRENIITDDPNEIITNYHFGDLKVTNGEILITNRLSKVLYRETIDKIL